VSRKIDRTPLALIPVRSMWTLPLGVALATPPAYDDTRAFFQLEGGRLAAYDILSGAQLWLVSAASSFGPVTGDGLAFLAAPDGLMALHAADGSVAWRVPLPDTLAVRPVWDNGWLVLSTTTGSTMAYRGTDGHLLWRYEAGVPAAAPPALAGDRVYVPVTDGRVLALRVETGVLVWTRRLGGPPSDMLALEDRLYVGSKDNFLYCLMAKDGRVDWRWRTGGDIIGVPFVDEGRVFFVSFDNVLRALDRTSGAQVWLRTLPLRPVWGAVKAGGSIVVAGQSAGAQAFNLKNGQPAGDLPAGAEVAATPHAFDHPGTTLPAVLFVTRDIAKGAAAILVMRNVEPPLAPVAPLPNLITLSPGTSRQP
jgi:outer membrane protein assembly factor BamB